MVEGIGIEGPGLPLEIIKLSINRNSFRPPYHSPLTIYHSPLTIHHSPFTIHCFCLGWLTKKTLYTYIEIPVTGRSSNGRTADSESAYRGSNPCLPAIFY